MASECCYGYDSEGVHRGLAEPAGNRGQVRVRDECCARHCVAGRPQRIQAETGGAGTENHVAGIRVWTAVPYRAAGCSISETRGSRRDQVKRFNTDSAEARTQRSRRILRLSAIVAVAALACLL